VVTMPVQAAALQYGGGRVHESAEASGARWVSAKLWNLGYDGIWQQNWLLVPVVEAILAGHDLGDGDRTLTSAGR
jgi:hypothetical protein